MKEQVKKLYCKITAIALAVIMVALLIACFAPMLKVKTADLPMNEEFTNGRYTSTVSVAEVDLGIGGLIQFLSDFRLANVVIVVQGNDADIARWNEEILKLEMDKMKAIMNGSTNTDSYDSSINTRREYIIEAEKSTAEMLASRTPEELAELDVLLHDDDFIDSVSFGYGFMALFDDTQWSDEYPDYADNTIHMMVFLFAITLFAVLTIALLIYLVVSIINVIIKGIYFGVRFMNADEKMLERLFPKKLAAFAGVLFFVVLMLSVFNGYGVAFGGGLITMIVCLIIANAIRGISLILLSDTISIGEIVKYAISVVAVILVLAILVSFGNIGVFDNVLEDGPEFMEKNYETEYKKEYDAYVANCSCATCTGGTTTIQSVQQHADYIKNADSHAKYEASKAANKSFKQNALLALGFDLVFAIVVFVAFINFIERLGAKTVKNKATGVVSNYGAMPAYGIILAICFIVPNLLFSVGTKDDRIKAYEEGKIKLLFDDYKVEETENYVKHQVLLEADKAADEAMVKLDEELDKATDDAVKENIKVKIGDAERAKDALDSTIDMYETKQKSGIVVGIIMSILLAATSFAYKYAIKPLEELVSGFIKKAPAAEEADAEVAPVEDAPAEGAPVEEEKKDDQ